MSYYSKQFILPFKMATRFIPYVYKPTNAKYSNKPLYKSMPIDTFHNSRQNEQNSRPIMSAVDGDLLMQKVNGDDGIIVKGTLTQHV